MNSMMFKASAVLSSAYRSDSGAPVDQYMSSGPITGIEIYVLIGR